MLAGCRQILRALFLLASLATLQDVPEPSRERGTSGATIQQAMARKPAPKPAPRAPAPHPAPRAPAPRPAPARPARAAAPARPAARPAARPPAARGRATGPPPKPARKPEAKPAKKPPKPTKAGVRKPETKPGKKEPKPKVKKTKASTGAGHDQPTQVTPGTQGAPAGLDDNQTAVASTILDEGLRTSAPRLALEASMYAALGETNLGADSNTYQDNGSGYGGVLQGSVADWPDLHDTTGMAQAFFTGTGPQGQTDFQTGANNWVAQGVTDVAQIAVQTEVPSIWPDNAYTHNDPATDAKMKDQASKIVDTLLPGLPAPGAAGSGEGAGEGGSVTPGQPMSFKHVFTDNDWSDDFVQLWDKVKGGSNEAARMSNAYRTGHVDKLSTIKAG